MPQVSIAQYNPPLEGARSQVIYTSAQVINEVFPVGSTEVAIIVSDLIPLRRQTEIFAAIALLEDGIRELNLLEDQFKGNALYTTVNIDRITEAGRLTSSENALVGLDTAVVSIAMGEIATGNDYVVMLDTAFEVMKKVLLENLRDQAA